MALEDMVGLDKFLDAFVITNPTLDDPVSQGDDHDRGTKNCVVNSFGAMAGLMEFPAAAKIADGAGSALLPHYAFNPDTNTGMYRIATDVLGFTTSGVEKLRIDAAGNMTLQANNLSVGVGAFPDTLDVLMRETKSLRFMTVAGSAERAAISGDNGENLAFFTGSAHTQRMTIDGAGSVGIGIAAPTEKLHIEDDVGRINISDGVNTKLLMGSLGVDAGAFISVVGAGATLETQLRGDAVKNFINATNGADLGVGNSAPQRRLDVRTILGVSPDDARITAELEAVVADASGALNLYTGEGTPILRARIGALGDNFVNTSTGNFGIGTTTPNFALEVGAGGQVAVQNNAAYLAKDLGGTVKTIGFMRTDDIMALGDGTVAVLMQGLGISVNAGSGGSGNNLELASGHTTKLTVKANIMELRSQPATAINFDIKSDVSNWRLAAGTGAGLPFTINDVQAQNATNFQIDAGHQSQLKLQNGVMTWFRPVASNAIFQLDNTSHSWQIQNLAAGGLSFREESAAATRLILDDVGNVNIPTAGGELLYQGSPYAAAGRATLVGGSVSITFGKTFATAPVVTATYEELAEPGALLRISAVTTTGCNIVGIGAFDVMWQAQVAN